MRLNSMLKDPASGGEAFAGVGVQPALQP